LLVRRVFLRVCAAGHAGFYREVEKVKEVWSENLFDFAVNSLIQNLIFYIGFCPKSINVKTVAHVSNSGMVLTPCGAWIQAVAAQGIEQ
jgi:hypothetical protein